VYHVHSVYSVHIYLVLNVIISSVTCVIIAWCVNWKTGSIWCS